MADVPGICVAGLLLNAGPLLTKALLEWGTSSYAGDAQNAGMLHVADALKRTWDTSLNYSVASGKLSIAIRSNSASERPSLMTWYLPEYLVNIWPGITRLGFFWVEGPCKPVPLLDIYRLKFEVFASIGWVLFYIGAVCVFAITHVSQIGRRMIDAVVTTIKRKLLWSFVTPGSNDDERYDDIRFIARHGQISDVTTSSE